MKTQVNPTAIKSIFLHDAFYCCLKHAYIYYTIVQSSSVNGKQHLNQPLTNGIIISKYMSLSNFSSLEVESCKVGLRYYNCTLASCISSIVTTLNFIFYFCGNCKCYKNTLMYAHVQIYMCEVSRSLQSHPTVQEHHTL